MNWYKVKVASVTFHLNDSYRISQPKTILRLCSEALRFLEMNGFKDVFQNSGQEPITPDGDSFDQYTGPINFYYNPKVVKPERVKQAIDYWIQEMSIMDYKITYNPTPNQSRLFPDRMTFRISVTQNPSQNYEQLPETNITNRNAALVLAYLGVIDMVQMGMPQDIGYAENPLNPHEENYGLRWSQATPEQKANGSWSFDPSFEYMGEVPLQDIKAKIESLWSDPDAKLRLQKITREQVDTHNLNIPQDADPEEARQIIQEQQENRNSNVRMIGGGLSREDIGYYVSQIYNIVNYGVTHGFKTLQFA